VGLALGQLWGSGLLLLLVVILLFPDGRLPSGFWRRAGVVHQALEPAHVSLWVSERG
jgi:hypothetical protein